MKKNSGLNANRLVSWLRQQRFREEVKDRYMERKGFFLKAFFSWVVFGTSLLCTYFGSWYVAHFFLMNMAKDAPVLLRPIVVILCVGATFSISYYMIRMVMWLIVILLSKCTKQFKSRR